MLYNFQHRFLSLLTVATLSLFELWPQSIEKHLIRIKNANLNKALISAINIKKVIQSSSKEKYNLLINIAKSSNSKLSSSAVDMLMTLQSELWRPVESIDLDGEIISILKKWVSSPSPRIRKLACEFALKGGYLELLKPISNLIPDKDYDVKTTCAVSFLYLSKFTDDRKSLKKTFNILLNEGGFDITSTLIMIAGEEKMQNFFPMVARFINHPAPEIRNYAIISATLINPEKSYKIIVPLIDNPDKTVRASVFKALQIINSDKAIELMTKKITENIHNRKVLEHFSKTCRTKTIEKMFELLHSTNQQHILLDGISRCLKNAKESQAPEKIKQTISRYMIKNIRKIPVDISLQLIERYPDSLYIQYLKKIRDKLKSDQIKKYLGVLSTIPSYETLILALGFADHHKPSTRIAALETAEAIADRINKPEIITGAILNRLTDRSEKVRVKALQMAGKYKIGKAAKPIHFLLSKLKPSERSAKKILISTLQLIGKNCPQYEIEIAGGLFSDEKTVRGFCLQPFEKEAFSCSNEILKLTIENPVFLSASEPGQIERAIATGKIIQKCFKGKNKHLLHYLSKQIRHLSPLLVISIIIGNNGHLLGQLKEILKSYPEGTRIKREIANLLWLSNCPETKELIVSMVSDTDPVVRAEALISVAESKLFTDDEKIHLLAGKLNDNYRPVRINASSLISEIAKNFTDIDRESQQLILSYLNGEIKGLEKLSALHMMVALSIHKDFTSKIERFIFSSNFRLKSATIQAIKSTIDRKCEFRLTKKVLMGLTYCAIGEKSSELRKKCQEILNQKKLMIIRPPGKSKYLRLTRKWTTKHLPPIFKIKTVEEEALPLTFRLEEFRNYPLYYPIVMIHTSGNVKIIFKTLHGFTGVDLNESASYIIGDFLSERVLNF